MASMSRRFHASSRRRTISTFSCDIARSVSRYQCQPRLQRAHAGRRFASESSPPAREWEAADLEPLGFHEGRHTFASMMIAAGVNAKALSTYMGHANISITIDRYGHLMPGSEAEARTLLGTYLDREGG